MKTNEVSFCKTNDVSFYKTNEVSFSKTSKTGFAKTYLPTHTMLREGGTKGSGLRQDHPQGECLMKPLANRLDWQTTPIKSLVMAAYPLRVLRSLALCAMLIAASPGMAQSLQPSSGQALPVVDVYKSPECGCCKAWAEHLQKNGFKVILHDVDDVPAARKKLGMPNRFGACHTARVGQYLVEGHVPAADIKQLLKEHPRAIGLAVPSMPPGSPGMEGERSVPYDTLLVTQDGNAKVFAHH